VDEPTVLVTNAGVLVYGAGSDVVAGGAERDQVSEFVFASVLTQFPVMHGDRIS
jgi:hypothetical protein